MQSDQFYLQFPTQMISLSDRDGESVYTDNNPEKHYNSPPQDKNTHPRHLQSNNNQFSQDDEDAQWPDLDQDYASNNDKLEEQNNTFDKLKAEIAQLLSGNTHRQSHHPIGEETEDNQNHKHIQEQSLLNPSPMDEWEQQMKQPIKAEVAPQKTPSIWKYIPRLGSKPKRKQQTEKQTKDENIQTGDASPSNLQASQYQQPFFNSREVTEKDSLLLSAQESNPAQEETSYFPLHDLEKQTSLLTKEETVNPSLQEELLEAASREFEGLLMTRKIQHEHETPPPTSNTAILQNASRQFAGLFRSKQSQQADLENNTNNEEADYFPQPTPQQEQEYSPEDKRMVKQCLREQILQLASREFEDLLLTKQPAPQEDEVELSYSQSRNFNPNNLPTEDKLLQSELFTVRDSFSPYWRPSVNSQTEQYPNRHLRQSHQRTQQQSQIMVYDMQKSDEKIKNEEQELKMENNKIQILHKIRNLLKMSANKHVQLEKSKHPSNNNVQSSIKKIVVEAESIIEQITQSIKLQQPHSTITQLPKQPTSNHHQQSTSRKVNDPLSRITMTKNAKTGPTDTIDLSKRQQQRKNEKETLIEHLQAVLSIREESLKELNYVNRELKQPRAPKNDFKPPTNQDSRISNKKQKLENSKKQLPDRSERQDPPYQQKPNSHQSETCRCEIM